MTEIGFAPKELIPPQVCILEVLAAERAEAHGLQIALKLKIVGGEYDGHPFTDSNGEGFMSSPHLEDMTLC
jgi:hypothetical protein